MDYVSDVMALEPNVAIDKKLNELRQAKKATTSKWVNEHAKQAGKAAMAIPKDGLAPKDAAIIRKRVPVMAGGEKTDALHLGNDRYLSVASFRDKTFVHVRHYFRMDGQPYPIATKRGIALTTEQWTKLRRYAGIQISAKLRELEIAKRPVQARGYLRVPLGDDVYASLSCFKDKLYVHIRVYENTGTRLIPTKKGIALTPEQWTVLSDAETTLYVTRRENELADHCKRKREEEEEQSSSKRHIREIEHEEDVPY